MITGDHAATAQAIGRQLGLGEAAPALVGADIERMDDAELMAAAQASRQGAATGQVPACH